MATRTMARIAARIGFAMRYRRPRVVWPPDQLTHLGACHCHRPNTATSSGGSVLFMNVAAARSPAEPVRAAR